MSRGSATTGKPLRVSMGAGTGNWDPQGRSCLCSESGTETLKVRRLSKGFEMPLSKSAAEEPWGC